MIDRDHELSVSRQAKVLSISRGSVNYLSRPTPAADLALMRRIDKLHLDYPFACRLRLACASPDSTASRINVPSGTRNARTSRRRFSASLMRMENGRVSGFALLCSAPFERSGDMILSPYIEDERCLRDREVSRRICSHSDNASKIWFDFSSEKTTISVDPGEIAAKALKGKVVSTVRYPPFRR